MMATFRSIGGQRGLAALLLAGLAGASILGGMSYAGGEQPRPVTSPSAEDINTMRAFALEFSRENGEPNPVRARVVAAPHALAHERLFGGGEIATDEDVYVVAMEGRFIGYKAHTPPGVDPPTGTHLVLVFEAATKRFAGWSLSDNRPALEQFADPVPLKG